MRAWIHMLDVSEFWNEESLTVVQKGDLIARELNQLLSSHEDDLELEDIIDSFKELDVNDSECESNIIFDEIMFQLYDWSDDNRVWIDTFGLTTTYNIKGRL